MFLSYCKSHIYGLHSLLVGTIIFFLIFVWKGTIDKFIEDRVAKRYEDREDDRRKAAARRTWGLIYILVILLAFLLFAAVACISPFVHNSVPASVISASFAITEMEFYKTFIKRKGD